MEESIRLFEEEKTPLTLELAGIARDGDDEGPRQVRVSIEQTQEDELGNEKFIVSLSPLMDTAHAGCAVDLLLDRWDSEQYVLHSLILGGLRFTQGGVSALTTFWGMQNVAQTIEQLALHDIIGGQVLREDEDSIFTICKSFQNAPNLESIDLSHNALGTYVWEALGKQTKLKHLCLNNVEMDDSSFQELRNVFACGDTLQSLTIMNRTPTGPAACQALDQILKSCRNLRSFVWEQGNHQQKAHENMPLAGLVQLSKNMFKNEYGYLRRLELTGGIVPNDPSMLCNALEGLHKLQELKLSRARLDSDKIQRIVTALRSARPPLSSIDFSDNQIDCEGASWIAQLSCLRAVTKNLQLLNLEDNRIAHRGAMEIVENFAPKCSNFALKLEGNNFDPSKMFLTLASAKHAAETELNDLRKDCDRHKADKEDAQSNLRELLQAQYTMVNDMQELKAKTKQLEEDKETLAKAFGVMGLMQHGEERDSILKRLAQLEEAVLGKGTKNGTKKGKKPPRVVKDSPESGPVFRKAMKSKSFDDVSPPPFALEMSRSASRVMSNDETSASPVPGNEPTLNRRRSLRSVGRPTSARHLMVKAASERWKNLIQNPKGSTEKKPKSKPMRSASTRSLAEFLNRSAPDALEGNSCDDSVSMMEDYSMQTVPAPQSASMVGPRRRTRPGISSTRSLPPPANEIKPAKSLPIAHPPPLDEISQDSMNNSVLFETDFARR